MDVRDCRTVRLPSSISRRFAERRPGSIGHITLRGKCAGARSAGKPHAACDVAGAGNGLTVRLVRHSHRKRGETDRPRLRSTAPALDPTAHEYFDLTGSVSPLLANVYLHYVFDLWVHQWRKRHARGEVIIARFADDFTVGFQYREDAERFLEELRERFQRFHLELHPEKTRLMEFGRYAAENRKRRGEGKPESFDFLGFTHTCDKTRNGKFIVLRQTMRKRLQSKLREIKIELKRRLHHPVPEVGQWLRSVMQGHFNYYAVPRNQRKLGAFKYQVYRLWLRTLRQRSQRHRMTGERMNRLADRWFPPIRILHPYPEQRLRVMT